jgi:type IV pilus assembly protein PilN
MRIDINLASQPYQDSRRFWVYWGTGLALLSIVSAMLVFLAVTGFMNGSRDRQQIASLQSKLDLFAQEKNHAEAVLNQPNNRVVRDRSRFLNALFQRKAFSWTRVFEELERVMPAHLHVVSIRPDLSADNNLEIKLVVGGETREQALDLVRKMEGSNRFKQTRIESEKFATEENQNVRGDRVEFNISALYVASTTPPSQTSGGVN